MTTMAMAITNQIAPLATTDQTLLGEKINCVSSDRASMNDTMKYFEEKSKVRCYQIVLI